MQQWHQVFLAEFAVKHGRSPASSWSGLAELKRKVPAQARRQAS